MQDLSYAPPHSCEHCTNFAIEVMEYDASSEDLSERQLKAGRSLLGDAFGTSAQSSDEQRKQKKELQWYFFFDIISEQLEEPCSRGCDFARYLRDLQFRQDIHQPQKSRFAWCARVSATDVWIGKLMTNENRKCDDELCFDFIHYDTFVIIRTSGM